jgi:putative oxidoreductase
MTEDGMTAFESASSGWTGRMRSVLRIVTAALFIEHGTQIVFGFPAAGPVAPFHLLSQIGIAGVLETFGGAALLLGLFTRPVAFILSGLMAVAYFEAHFPHSLFPAVNQGDPAVLFCFVFLYFSIAGGGEWNADAVIRHLRDRRVRQIA